MQRARDLENKKLLAIEKGEASPLTKEEEQFLIKMKNEREIPSFEQVTIETSSAESKK